MKLSPINNLAFGYNKRLSQRLNKRLTESSTTPTTNLVSEIHSILNATESEIIHLEDEKNGGIERNEEQINTLLSIFLGAKRSLCNLVDKLYPELNFTKATMDALDQEQTERDELYEDTAISTQDIAYKWREVLYEKLEGDEELKDTYNSLTSDYVGSKALSTPSKSGVGVGLGEDGKKQILNKFEPSSSSPKSLNDVVGLDNCIRDIEDLIVFPLEYPEKIKQREQEYGIKVPSFCIFYGPPGCGKTMVAEAIAAQTDCEMYKLDLSNVGSTYVNESAINVANAFKEVEEIASKSDKPIILFMDEADSLLTKRGDNGSRSSEDDKVVNTFLPLITRMEDKNVIIICATNRYDALDSAIKSRAKYKAYIGLPKQDDIKELLERRLSQFDMGRNLVFDDEAINRISKSLIGYAPRDINEIVRSAFLAAYRKDRPVIEEDFTTLLQENNWEKINEQEYLPENKKIKKTVGFKK